MVSRSPGEFGCSWRTHAHHSASVSPLSCVFFGVASEPRCRRSAFGRFPSVPRVSFFFHADVILSIFACAACYFLAAPLHLLPFASACCSNIASSAFFVAFPRISSFPSSCAILAWLSLSIFLDGRFPFFFHSFRSPGSGDLESECPRGKSAEKERIQKQIIKLARTETGRQRGEARVGGGGK